MGKVEATFIIVEQENQPDAVFLELDKSTAIAIDGQWEGAPGNIYTNDFTGAKTKIEKRKTAKELLDKVLAYVNARKEFLKTQDELPSALSTMRSSFN